MTADLTKALQKMGEFKAPSHIAFFNFDGGLRDFFVGTALASSSLSCPGSKDNCLDIKTEVQKNVQSSLDHNS